MSIALNMAQGVLAGAVAYAFCQVTHLPNPFEKAVFTTILLGLQFFTGTFIMSRQNWSYKTRRFLTQVCLISAIPSALFICQLLKIKVPDYLHQVGISYIAYTIIAILSTPLVQEQDETLKESPT